jgi:hypothetical protein
VRSSADTDKVRAIRGLAWKCSATGERVRETDKEITRFLYAHNVVDIIPKVQSDHAKPDFH